MASGSRASSQPARPVRMADACSVRLDRSLGRCSASTLAWREQADAAHDLEQPDHLRIEEGLAAGHERHGEVPLRIRPGDDVGEADVAEGARGPGAVEAEPLRAEHESHAVAEWQPEREIDLEIALIGSRPADGRRLEELD